ncbi:MAG: hypothetical protein IIW01_11275, partial [Thermoguttaceae bacterium]|nr:hypothetical protein [Thermoguttaceae bacterium]
DASDASTTNATQTLGADEVVLFARPDVDGTLAANPKESASTVAAAPRRKIIDEGNVKWIAPTAAESAAVASAPTTKTGSNAASRLSDGSGDSSAVAQSKEVAKETQKTQDAKETQTAQATQAPKVAKVAQATPSANAAQPPRRASKRVELNAEPPTLRAGSFF